MFGGLGYTSEMVIDKLVRDVRHDLVFRRYLQSEDLRV